jgi:hypothetical protein
MKYQNEKQAIEEMRKDLVEIFDEEYERRRIITADFTAIKMSAKGYCKQSEGEWVYNHDGMDWGLGAWHCSLCGCNNNNLPMDNRVNPLRFAGTKYCGNCGARMKGGAK